MTVRDAVVVGGGAIGCAVTYFLARRGLRVTLLERDTLASQASGAAAGMLAPVGEAHAAGGEGATEPSPLLRWGLRSLAMFPELCEALREIAGIDPEYEASGLLRVAASESEQSGLEELASRLPECDLSWVDDRAARAAAPGLAVDVRGGLWSPREAHVRSPLLTRAFATAARQLGAEVRLGVPVHGLLRDGDRVLGVRTAEGQITAGGVVVCTGAFAGELGDWTGGAWAPPVSPVRGQILALDAPRPGFRCIVWGAAYLVPKRDGSVVVGATEERVGFDRRLTARGIGSLIRDAEALMPGLGDAGFRLGWAGLRPGTPDDLPGIGPVPGCEGLWVAVGHYRNGVLLSPVTGQLVADQLTGKAVDPDAAVFDPARWSR